MGQDIVHSDSEFDRHRKLVKGLAEEVGAGRLDRREFLAMASIFGASAAAAYGLIGLAAGIAVMIAIADDNDDSPVSP